MVQLLLRQVKHVNLFNQFVRHCFLQNLRNTEIPNLVEKNLQYYANGYEPTNIRLIYN